MTVPVNSYFAKNSTILERSAQKVGWGDGGMGASCLQQGKKEKKNQASKDTLTDGAPHPLWDLGEQH